MAGQFFNFSKYFKKNDSSSNADQPKDDSSSTTIVTTSTTTASQQPVSVGPYSGIGNPPQGVAYNGIGNPPQMKQPVPTPQSSQFVQQPISSGQQPSSTSSQQSSIAQQSVSGQPAFQQTPSSPSSSSSPAPFSSSKSAIDMKKRVGMDVLSRLTQRSNQVLMTAVSKAKELKIQYIDTEHVLWALLADSSIYQLLSELKVTPSEIQAELEKSFKPGNFTGQPHFSPRLKRVLELSLAAARSAGYEFISPEHILLALSKEGEGMAARTLSKFGVKPQTLSQRVTGKKEDKKEEDRGRLSTLELYAEDLTAKAAKGELDPVVARSSEIERVVHILSRRTKNNPVLIGEAGVGKTAIVEGLAQRVAHGDAPESLLHKRILALDLMSLIAGASHRGEFEERLKNLIKEIKGSAGNIILFIDEIHNMVGAGSGGEGTMDASNILKPSLARGELQTIGTTTITEYRKYIEKDPALERRFQPVLIAEPTVDQAIEMLHAIEDKYEAFHRVKITDESIEAAVKLSQRYIGDRFLPDKAVDLIDEAAAAVRLPAISLPENIKSEEERLKKLQNEGKEAEKIGDTVREQSVAKEIQDIEHTLNDLKEQYQLKKSTATNEVTVDSIQQIISRWTGIPVSKMTESESAKLLELEDIIHKRLIDQESAVSAVAEAVRRGRAGLKSNKRPIGSFIFMGPTGVGKTELAKTLAETIFGTEEVMIRFDMTEYMEKHEAAKLIGAPPGYVGYEEGGQLTEAVRRHPYSVVLFDEVEKAHPDVFNILIQLLDDGRLTDNKGHTISFKNTIVICTSNLGSGIIQDFLMKNRGVFNKAPDLPEEKEEGKEEKKKTRKVMRTYVSSPTGREIITLYDKLWEKNVNDTEWKASTLKDYFAGSVVTEGEQVAPTGEIDTHVIASDGSETITQAERLWFRTSTSSKEWAEKPLVTYFKDHAVTNALPDKPKEQLPTARLDSHAITPLNEEIISVDDQVWRRKNLQTKEWMTGPLAEYFLNCTVTEAYPAEGDQSHEKEGKPEEITKSGRGNLFVTRKAHQSLKVKNKPDENRTEEKNSGQEVDTKNPSVQKFDDNIDSGENDSQKADSKNPQDKKPDEKMNSEAEAKKETEEEEKTQESFPTKKWDIHLFTSTGQEIIMCDGRYWTRKSQTDTSWVSGYISDFFSIQKIANAKKGDELPLGTSEKTVSESLEDQIFGEMANQLMDELRKFFRAELINRFDEVVVFRPLTRKHMNQIVDLQLKTLGRLLLEQNISLTVSPKARDYLTEIGYDPVYGARPLRRIIQRTVENQMSSFLIKGDLGPGDKLFVDFADGELTFTVEKLAKKKGTADAQASDKQTGSGVSSGYVLTCSSCGTSWPSEKPPEDNAVCPSCGGNQIVAVETQKKDQELKQEGRAVKKFTCQKCGNSWQGEMPADGKVTCPNCKDVNVTVEDVQPSQPQPSLKQLICSQCGNSWQAEVKEGETPTCPKCNSQSVVVSELVQQSQESQQPQQAQAEGGSQFHAGQPGLQQGQPLAAGQQPQQNLPQAPPESGIPSSPAAASPTQTPQPPVNTLGDYFGSFEEQSSSSGQPSKSENSSPSAASASA